jgi:serine/threonine protein kinase
VSYYSVLNAQKTNLDQLKHAEFSHDKALKWSDRLAILIGVAKAVHFLHTGIIPACFRNQLKTNNVLLHEHRFPKLSDYGMSLIAEEIENIEVLLLSIIFINLTLVCYA